MPRRIVMMNPPGSLPGMISLASTPITRPQIIVQSMLPISLPPLFSLWKRVCQALVLRGNRENSTFGWWECQLGELPFDTLQLQGIAAAWGHTRPACSLFIHGLTEIFRDSRVMK